MPLQTIVQQEQQHEHTIYAYDRTETVTFGV